MHPRRSIPALIGLVVVSALARPHAQTQTTAPPVPEPSEAAYEGCVVDEAVFAAGAALERNPVRSATGPQVVMTTGTSGVAYVVVGPRERELVQYVGMHIEASGVIEPAPESPVRTRKAPQPTEPARPASGAAGVTPRGSPAHEPGDAVAAAGAQDAGTTEESQSVTATETRPASISELPRLNVTSIRRVSGRCATPLASIRTAGSRTQAAERQAPTKPARPVSTEPADPGRAVTVVGCLVRWSDGEAPAPGSPGAGRLAVTSATMTPQETGRQTAVPGSSPSGTGSGTVGISRRGAPRAEGVAYFVAGDSPSLASHVGQRVAIAGTLRPADRGAREPDGHVTAPSGTVTVTSIQSVAGTCR